MIPLEDMEALLEEISAEFPEQLFDGLNGGIILLPEAKLKVILKSIQSFRKVKAG